MKAKNITVNTLVKMEQLPKTLKNQHFPYKPNYYRVDFL